MLRKNFNFLKEVFIDLASGSEEYPGLTNKEAVLMAN
jgi:hypothetical protein